jgi:hypothetical protein
MPPEFLAEISSFTLRVCTPIYWHDRTKPFPKEVRGASCFFLRFEERVVGVTANHVVEAFRTARAEIPSLVCQVRLTPFDVEKALIDFDAEIDVATFGVSEDELRTINAVAVDCRGAWPPPTPAPNDQISLAGFPRLCVSFIRQSDPPSSTRMALLRPLKTLPTARSIPLTILSGTER